MVGDTLLRQWLMLQCIPVHPRRRSTREIAGHLQSEGYRCTIRTVQRDLEKLSAAFAYSCDTEGRANLWYFPREPRMLQIPGMDSAAALAFVCVRDYLRPMFPPSTARELKPYFTRAEEVLEESVPAALSSWRRRIKLISRGPALKSPVIAEAVQREVYNALLDCKQLVVMYQARNLDQSRELRLHPQALVLRDGLMYLVATAWDYSDLRHYALHRIRRAAAQDEPARLVRNVDLDAYVEQAFHYPASPSALELVLRMDTAVAVHLQERPLSDDQKFTSVGGELEISATVADTEELRWWLLSFGELVEVIKPLRLREEICRRAMALSRRYTETRQR